MEISAFAFVPDCALMSPLLLPANYETFLSDLKNRVSAAQNKAALAVNSELVSLYWQIGRAF